MAQYVNITLDEMREFLVNLPKSGHFHCYGEGNVPKLDDKTVEKVFGHVFKMGPGTACFRVYTGINPDGDSRDVGADAIRVYVYYRNANGDTRMVHKARRVHRVKGWRDNLKARLFEAIDGVRRCPKCDAAMAERTSKTEANPGRKFHSCMEKDCKGFKWKDEK